MIGIDGCRGGWVAIALRDGAYAGAAFVSELADLDGQFELAPSVIAVDIPIGLPAIGDQEVRRCDVEARRRLGRRGSSVFAAPPLEVLELEPYAAANALAKKRWGRGISTQAYNLRPKILEAAPWAERVEAVHEVHPELSFMAMNGGEPLESKRSAEGANARAALLSRAGIDLGDVPANVARSRAADVLDAAAAAWSATRIAREQNEALPRDVRPGEPTISF